MYKRSNECFHSRGQHICKFIGTEESVCIRKEFNSQRTGLGHQHGRRFIVLEHQYGRRDVYVKTLHSVNIALRNGKTSNKGVQLILHDCCTHESSLHCFATNSLSRVARVGSISASKPVHVACITCPEQTCFAARDAPPVYGVTSRVVLSDQKSVFTLHAST